MTKLTHRLVTVQSVRKANQDTIAQKGSSYVSKQVDFLGNRLNIAAPENAKDWNTAWGKSLDERRAQRKICA